MTLTHTDLRHGPLASSARKTRASSAARATTSTTSSCRACSTWTSCAAPTPTRRSRTSTPRRRCKVPGVLAVITGKDLDKLRPGLDADADERHPDGAADRHGDVPGAGGGGGGRHQPLRRRRRRRRWSRSSTSRCRRWSTRSRRSKPDAPLVRPDKRGKKTNHIWHWEAGDRAATDDGLRRGRGRRQAGHLHPAHPRRVDRDLRLRRRLRHGRGQADHLHDDAGAARHPHGLRAGRRALGLRSTRSASSRRTSAAASAARCRSIPAT